MPFTPSKLTARVREMSFLFDGEEVRMSYRPAELNDTNIARIRAIGLRLATGDVTKEEEDALTLEFAGYFAKILVTWEFEEDGGKDGKPSGVMVPITAERIVQEMARYGDFIAAHMRMALDDYQQGKATGTASSKR